MTSTIRRPTLKEIINQTDQDCLLKRMFLKTKYSVLVSLTSYFFLFICGTDQVVTIFMQIIPIFSANPKCTLQNLAFETADALKASLPNHKN